MRHLAVFVCVAGLLAAACSSDPESTIDAPVATVAATLGDAAPSNSAAPPTAESNPEPTAATVSSSIDSAVSSTAPSTTSKPTSRPASTIAPAQAAPAPATTADEPPIGDGPVLTGPPTGGGLAPVFFGFRATVATSCDVADPGTVTLEWEVIGTETVSVAIGTETQVYSSDEPPATSLAVPLNCVEGSTYFVIAENPEGRTVRSTTVSP